MTRRKKGPAPKRKPVVRRVGTKEERAFNDALRNSERALREMKQPQTIQWSAIDDPTTWTPNAPCGVVPLYPSRWSRVVAWVRENPLEATLVAGWLALTAAIVAVLP